MDIRFTDDAKVHWLTRTCTLQKLEERDWVVAAPGRTNPAPCRAAPIAHLAAARGHIPDVQE
jgi:hypothetical protein